MMRRILALLLVVLTLSGCTPDQIRWYGWFDRPAPVPCREWVGATRIAGFTEDELPTIHRLMMRESRCLPWAVSRTDDYGLLQVHGSWIGQLCAAGIACTRRELLNPQTNADAARYVFLRQGFSAWTTY